MLTSSVLETLLRRFRVGSATWNDVVAVVGAERVFVVRMNRILRDPSRAEDVFQDFLVKLQVSTSLRRGLVHARSPLGFLVTAAMNAARDERKRDVRRREESLSEEHAGAAPEQPPPLDPPMRAAIVDFLRGLDPDDRRAFRAFQLYHVGGEYTWKEVAQQFGCTEDQVKMSVSRLKKRLRNILEGLR
jgi:RNA polymerase sigma factor (sigma-70 family)